MNIWRITITIMESDEKMPVYKTNGIALIMSPCEWQWGLEQNGGKKITSLTTHEIQPINLNILKCEISLWYLISKTKDLTVPAVVHTCNL